MQTDPEDATQGDKALGERDKTSEGTNTLDKKDNKDLSVQEIIREPHLGSSNEYESLKLERAH